MTDPVAAVDSRLDEAAEALEAAETEADLDDVRATLDAIADDIADIEARLPDESDEETDESPADAPDPDAVESIADRLADLESDLDAARGPYAEDIVEEIETIESTVRETRFTETGDRSIRDAVETFAEALSTEIGTTVSASGPTTADLADAVSDASDAITGAGLDPDDDAATIAALLEATDDLDERVDAAQTWTDLEIRERLERAGFYDVIEPDLRKDFPPEDNAARIHAARYKESGDSEAIEQMLLALEVLDSDFMEENLLELFKQIAPPEAFDAVHERAQRRNRLAIEVLGKIGDDRAVETLVDFLDGAQPLELTTLDALGAIGSREATQAVADRLAADAPAVRSTAARALGRIGDPRAIDPLEELLETDPADEVRASAAWALVQIGTERALDAARQSAEDRSPLVASAAPEA